MPAHPRLRECGAFYGKCGRKHAAKTPTATGTHRIVRVPVFPARGRFVVLPSWGAQVMPGWWNARKESKQAEAESGETLIRVCVVSRDPALVEEAHKDLMVGFSTRGGYDFEPGHPDFQHYCDVLLVDLRASGVQALPEPVMPDSAAVAAPAMAGMEDGLAFIDAIRKSVSHPPIVVLCDADAGEFARAVMRHGAYERLTAPLRMSQLRLALQRAYEFRLAETRLESFLTAQTAAHEKSRKATTRKSFAQRATTLLPPVLPRQVRVARKKLRARSAPSRLAIGFVLGCVIFFAIVVGVRTLLAGMSDALASARFTSDSAVGLSGTVAGDAHAGLAARARPWSTAGVAPAEANSDLGRLSFRGPASTGPLGASSPVPGYEPAEIVERVTPRYSAEARAAHLQGIVSIRAVIGRDGVPHGLARVSGDPVLAQIAMDAISLWRYAPATIDDTPVESELIIPIEFRLPD